jgi:hypothetical protein
MEPVSTTAIYSLLTYFIGYFVGADFHNYYKSQQNFRHLESELISINRKLDKIDNRLDTMNNKLP